MLRLEGNIIFLNNVNIILLTISLIINLVMINVIISY